MLVIALKLASLLKRNFCYVLFPGNFYSNCSSKFLSVAGSERLDIKYSLSNTRKTSKEQKKLFVWATVTCSRRMPKSCFSNFNLSITDMFFEGCSKLFFFRKAISQNNSDNFCKGCQQSILYFDCDLVLSKNTITL